MTSIEGRVVGGFVARVIEARITSIFVLVTGMFFLGTLDDTVNDEKLETAPARLPLLAAATASFFVALF